MTEDSTLRCEHCGQTCEDEDELNIFHRGCRLKAAFPDAYTAAGGLLKFDMAKIKAKLDSK